MDGSLVDSEPLSYNGKIFYGSTYSASDRHGKNGGAMRFNNSVVEIPQFRNYDFGDQLTFSFWMKRTSKLNYMGIINSGYTTESLDIRVGRENNGSFIFAQSNWDIGRTSSLSRNVIKINKWHHVAVVLNNGSSKMYVDGNFIHESNTGTGSLTVINTPGVEANVYGTNHENFKGSLDGMSRTHL